MLISLHMGNQLKWKPVFSFGCLLASIFFISAIISPQTASIIVGSFTGFIALFAGLLPDHYNCVKNFWFDKILPGTHTILIYVFIIVSLISAIIFFKNYKLSFKLEKI